MTTENKQVDISSIIRGSAESLGKITELIREAAEGETTLTERELDMINMTNIGYVSASIALAQAEGTRRSAEALEDIAASLDSLVKWGYGQAEGAQR